MAHVPMDCRRILPVNAQVIEADGFCERQATHELHDRPPRRAGRREIVAEEPDDTAEFAHGCRERTISRHPPCNDGRSSGSAFEGRRARHAGCLAYPQRHKRYDEGVACSKIRRSLGMMKLTDCATADFMAMLTAICSARPQALPLRWPWSMTPV